MTIDPNCWVELSGVSPAAQSRGPRVTTAPGDAVPGDGVPPIEGDIHVNIASGNSYVYDAETGWQLLSGKMENSYWGRGYGGSLVGDRGKDTKPPAPGEAYVEGRDDPNNPGQTIYTLWYFRTGDDGIPRWMDPPNPIKPGDDYTDTLTGRTWALDQG